MVRPMDDVAVQALGARLSVIDADLRTLKAEQQAILRLFELWGVSQDDHSEGGSERPPVERGFRESIAFVLKEHPDGITAEEITKELGQLGYRTRTGEPATIKSVQPELSKLKGESTNPGAKYKVRHEAATGRFFLRDENGNPA